MGESPSTSSSCSSVSVKTGEEQQKQVRMKRKTLQAVLEQCQRTLELLNEADLDPILEEEEVKKDKMDGSLQSSPTSAADDSGTDQLNDLLKSRIESPNFLEKLGSIHTSVSNNTSEESSSWNMVTTTDLWDDKNVGGEIESDQDGYILVSQEDIVDGIACFMAAYLLSLKQTKDLNPNQLQEALSKTFSVKKRKGKLRKAWDGTQVIYNVASWGATAVGIYQNPALLKAASAAFWTSCHVISKLF